ncbi:methyltransferase domain-containing protein [Glutamicibacter ardleyensis]|uniref:Methyltransferase domain-containing protein n=1 Tax=Glutamicibacter ardleyensis TaxID=225894 RepID=A0ABQ2D9U4_9MICC|nr:methyltransferase domain-containing protein [Glutamicibacter ardleyensis]GGJ48800.1 hypothetical protein GCM10007173_04260 [Glutamicibacter ardleyensis]
MFELVRAKDAVEEMDRPDCDPVLLRRTYAQFPLVNRAVAGWGRLYAELIVDQLPAHRPATLLDIGCGGGDITIMLAKRAWAEGINLKVLGIDPDERAFHYAHGAGQKSGLPASRLEFRQCDSSQLVAQEAQFDVVISNHLLHHLDEQQFSGLLADSQRLATGRAMHADIRRSRLAAVLFGAATLPLAGSSFIRRDGLLSIRRSSTPVELARRVPARWRVEERRPFRNLLLWEPAHAL